MKTVKMANGVTYQFTEGHKESLTYDWRGQPGAEPMYAAEGGAMSKTTPGPWKMNLIDASIGRFSLEDANGRDILFACNCCHDEKDAISEPDARLIAAAPELLEALREFVEADGEYVVDPEYSRALIRRIEEG